MPKYLIERNIPGASKLSATELQAIAAKSNSVLRELGPDVQWVQSYVAALWPHGPWQAALAEARGALAASQGELAAASVHLLQASAVYAQIGQHGRAARCAAGVEVCYPRVQPASLSTS